MSFDIYMSYRRYGPDMKVRLTDTQTGIMILWGKLVSQNLPSTINLVQYVTDRKSAQVIYSLDSESDVLCLNR